MVFRTALPNQSIASLSANARAYGSRIRPLSDATTNHTPTDPGAPISKAPVACRFRLGRRERHRSDGSVRGHPRTRRLQPFRHLHDCSGCFRLERWPGGACTHWKSAALPRRTPEADIRPAGDSAPKSAARPSDPTNARCVPPTRKADRVGTRDPSRGKISQASQTAHETDARCAKRTVRPGGVVVQSLNSVQFSPTLMKCRNPR